MSSILVTGGGRGLGLELVKLLSERPASEVSVVFAATRSEPSAPLQALIDRSHGRIVHVLLAVTDKESIKRGAARVAEILGPDAGLDILINNAAVLYLTPDGVATMNDLAETLKINVEAPHDCIAAFLPLLRKGKDKKVVNVTSTMGSIAQSQKFMYMPSPAYKISKTALNMLTVQYALDEELKKEGFAFLMVSPGWLKTDLGSQKADLAPEVGAQAVLDIVFKSTQAQSGVFQNILVPGWENAEGPNQYDGKYVPW